MKLLNCVDSLARLSTTGEIQYPVQSCVSIISPIYIVTYSTVYGMHMCVDWSKQDKVLSNKSCMTTQDGVDFVREVASLYMYMYSRLKCYTIQYMYRLRYVFVRADSSN